jgi:hypothetical protein
MQRAPTAQESVDMEREVAAGLHVSAASFDQSGRRLILGFDAGHVRHGVLGVLQWL